MKTSKENMEDHTDSLLLLTRDDWNLNNRCEMLYHIKQLQSHIKDIGVCKNGSADPYKGYVKTEAQPNTGA